MGRKAHPSYATSQRTAFSILTQVACLDVEQLIYNSVFQIGRVGKKALLQLRAKLGHFFY